MRVKVKGNVISASFLKIEEWGTLVKAKDLREGWLVELVDDQNPDPEAPPRKKIGRERKEQRRCRGRSDGEE